MKKIIAVLLSFTFLIPVSGFLSTPVAASDTSGNIMQNDDVVIYNKYGERVYPKIISALPGLKPLGKNVPTKIKYIKGGQFYESNPFTGSGTRYSGYIYKLKGIYEVHIAAINGNFKLHLSYSSTGLPVAYTSTLKANEGPYMVAMASSLYFYLSVKNPKNHQYYEIETY
ncbi:hypothetical protein [Lactobacillus panisapium]|uniref:hypothetical protein n=1 Tax=Lactobacillus panisapium TaxID=2012495 RepID=UPI0022E6ECB0|nr:hypothetical protein [Lactobacillus panisapium]